MLHTKSKANLYFGSREEDIQRAFTVYGGYGGQFGQVAINIFLKRKYSP